MVYTCFLCGKGNDFLLSRNNIPGLKFFSGGGNKRIMDTAVIADAGGFKGNIDFAALFRILEKFSSTEM